MNLKNVYMKRNIAFGLHRFMGEVHGFHSDICHIQRVFGGKGRGLRLYVIRGALRDPSSQSLPRSVDVGKIALVNGYKQGAAGPSNSQSSAKCRAVSACAALAMGWLP